LDKLLEQLPTTPSARRCSINMACARLALNLKAGKVVEIFLNDGDGRHLINLSMEIFSGS
jgi:hypothetical protein